MAPRKTSDEQAQEDPNEVGTVQDAAREDAAQEDAAPEGAVRSRAVGRVLSDEERDALASERQARQDEMDAHGVFAHPDDQRALDRAKDPASAPGDDEAPSEE